MLHSRPYPRREDGGGEEQQGVGWKGLIAFVFLTPIWCTVVDGLVHLPFF
jgi:hypothetical protein